MKKLFKISIEIKAQKENEAELCRQQSDEDHQMTKFNKSLKPFKLMSFQHRVINNLMNYAKKINTLPRAPSLLKAILDRSSNSTNSTTTHTRSTRQGLITYQETMEKHSDLTFSFFFNKLINSFQNYDFCLKNDYDFAPQILADLDEFIFSRFIRIFPKFNRICNSQNIFQKIR